MFLQFGEIINQFQQTQKQQAEVINDNNKRIKELEELVFSLNQEKHDTCRPSKRARFSKVTSV